MKRTLLFVSTAAAVSFGLIFAQQATAPHLTAGMIGEIGVAQTALVPQGKVSVHGEIWNAVSSVQIGAGDSVRVTAVDGLMLRVEPSSVRVPEPVS